MIMNNIEAMLKIRHEVIKYFSGDAFRAGEWFKSENPLLGGVSPYETMSRDGGIVRVYNFVMEAVEQNTKIEGQNHD